MLGKKKGKKKGKQSEGAQAAEELEEALKQEGKKKKGGKKKLLLLIPVVLIVAGAAFFLLKGRLFGGGAEKEPEVEEEPDDIVEAPSAYTIGDTELLALPVLSEDVVVHSPEPPEPAEGEEPITAVTYRYEGFEDPKGMLSGYAGLLSTADMGYVYVDENLTVTEAPDFEEETGSATLAKAGSTEGTVCTVRLEWSAEDSTIVTDSVEGQIRQPRPETLTLSQAEDYVRSMAPADLGLSGESMDEYNVYSLAGSVLVDGKPCLHITVYSVDETSGTNAIAGEYFIAADKSHIYRRDSVSGRVSEVS